MIRTWSLALLALGCSFASTLFAGNAWQNGDAPDTVLVSFQPGAPAAAVKGLLQAVQGSVDLDLPSIHLQRVRLPAGGGAAAVDAAIKAYGASPYVLAAEGDHPTKIASVSLDDPLYISPNASQWYLTSTAWPQAVAAYNAGSFTLPGTVLVAVVDTGIDDPFGEFGSRLVPGISYVPSEGPTTDDQNGHGTFCTGLIAAQTGNGAGMAGGFIESAKIKVLPVKVLNGCGSGNTSDLVAGILYAAAQGARVINLSIQSSTGSTALENAVDTARSGGALVVAAAGNDYGGPTSFPANYSQVMAVGALDHLDARAAYSNDGKLELSAPGGDLQAASGDPSSRCVVSADACCPHEIWSLASFHLGCSSPSNPTCSKTNAYEAGAGTSFAAPQVVAAAAMLFSQDPSRRVEDVQRILMQTASATAYGPGYHAESGWGKLNYAAALLYQSTPQTGTSLKAYNWPNPFNPEKDGLTTLTFFLPDAQAAKLRLFDAGGDLVKQWDLPAGQAQAGLNLVTWDGRNGQARMVASGVYTLAVDSGGKRVLANVAVLH